MPDGRFVLRERGAGDASVGAFGGFHGLGSIQLRQFGLGFGQTVVEGCVSKLGQGW